MIICFECSTETKRILDTLLELDDYSDYSQVIASALQTLDLLKREMAGSKSIVIGNSTISSQPTTKGVFDNADGPSPFHNSNGKQVKQNWMFSIPPLFGNDNLQEATVFGDTEGRISLPHEKVPLDRWVFAMYNKLLPAKANCRALAHLQSEYGGTVSLAQARERIGRTVIELGDYLRHLDETNQLKHDDTLAVAFPTSKDIGEKSINRYVNQFVGSVNKFGQLSSLLVAFKLVAYELGRDPKILLTKAGWELAKLPNPLLDRIVQNPSQRFSAEEIHFLISHIKGEVLEEHFAYRTIINEIMKGNDSPNGVDLALKSQIPTTNYSHFSNSFLTSQRSGAVSRMADLGLICRIHKGLHVQYQVTQLGRHYFDNDKKS